MSLACFFGTGLDGLCISETADLLGQQCLELTHSCAKNMQKAAALLTESPF